MSKDENLKEYYSRLIAVERHSPLTAETYCAEIRRFLTWLEDTDLTLERTDSPSLVRYLDLRRTRDGIDARSAAKAVSILRSFFRYVNDKSIRSDNPAVVLELPRRSLHLPEVHSRETVDKLLGMMETGTPRGLRDRALFELIYSAGLRISEASVLNIRDLDFSRELLRVRGKGSKERFVPLGEEAARWLRRYLKEGRPVLAGARPGNALFIGRTGKRLSRKGIWKNYAVLADQAGIGSKIHTLRHSYATELLAGGADLRSVQELLGHADLSTTQIYTHVDVSLLRESHRRYMPKLRGYAGES
ncbi:MAG: tyrosine recombinase [Treponema sp.]|jgi:integrase/recombinase XerD|nr:tyrosine recombinase [Treponema sp.]